MNEQKRALLLMHISVFLWGFTAIMGKLISLNEVVLVWYRTLFTAISLLFIPIFWKKIKNTPIKSILIFAFIGCLVALHWYLFYGSIKYANASVGVACIGTTSLLTALIEPLMTKNKIRTIDILFGSLVIPGILLISNASPKGYLFGILMGIFSALIAAIFSILNKKHTVKHNPVVVSWTQMMGAFIFTSCLLPFYLFYFPNSFQLPNSIDFIYLIVLSVLCTALPFILSIWAFRHLSAFTWVFIVNLEPLYGILLAIILLKENKELGINFYIGVLIILFSVVGKFIWENKTNKQIV